MWLFSIALLSQISAILTSHPGNGLYDRTNFGFNIPFAFKADYKQHLYA